MEAEISQAEKERLRKILSGETEPLVVLPDGRLVPERDRGAYDIETRDGAPKTVLDPNHVWFACWWEAQDGARFLEADRRQIAERFPQFEFQPWEDLADPRWCGKWTGELLTGWGTSYEIEVRYPRDWPVTPMGAYCLAPPIHTDAHIYADGRLCLLHPNDFQSGKTLAFKFVAWVAEWLHAYEVWRDSGRKAWPGKAADRKDLEAADVNLFRRTRGGLA